MKLKKQKSLLLPLIFLGILTLFPKTSWPQLVLGQYEDEAPLRTWNTLGLTTAPSLALGKTHFSIASDCSVALLNPALLAGLPSITFTLNSSFNTASLFKYSIVNTGVISRVKNVTAGFNMVDFIGSSIKIKNWIFTASLSLIESYTRPEATDNYYYRDTLYYSINFTQEGNLKNLNFSVARKIFGDLSVGIGLNYVFGYLKKNITDKDFIRKISITQSISEEFQGFYINGGLMLDLAGKLEIAALFRTPYVKKSEGESLYSYSSPGGNTYIKIEGSGVSEYKQPLVAGLGACYKFSPDFRVSSDFTFFNWSKYNVIYFKEEDNLTEEEEKDLYGRERNFKDIIKIGVGVEYLSPIRIFGPEVIVPLRAGLIYDPQPMKEPNSKYFYFTFGSGIYWGKLFLDAGMSFGSEKGSGNSLTAQKFALSLSFRL